MGDGATNGNGEAITLDAVTYYVHQGKVRGFYVEDADLDTGESMDTLIVVGRRPLHITLEASAFGGQVLAYIYEGSKYSDPGTLVRRSRFNRTINVPMESLVYSGPTITSLGDEFLKRRILAHAQGSAGITSAVKTGVERVLSPSTAYLLRQTSLADNIAITLTGVMYEE